MTNPWFFLLCQFSVIACAVVAGVFLTFSDFVMRSLDGAETAAGVEVMQVINREVFLTVFMVLLIGMSALSPFLIGYAYTNLSGAPATMIMIGGAIYLVGVFGVTVFFNVPMNVHLDGIDHTGTEAASYWAATYFPDWTFWNHVRTCGSAASAICYLVACTAIASGSLATAG